MTSPFLLALCALEAKGSDGGHNGLKDIQAVLGRRDYARLKFGVGNDFPKGRQADYVLSPGIPDQQEALPTRIEQATKRS